MERSIDTRLCKTAQLSNYYDLLHPPQDLQSLPLHILDQLFGRLDLPTRPHSRSCAFPSAHPQHNPHTDSPAQVTILVTSPSFTATSYSSLPPPPSLSLVQFLTPLPSTPSPHPNVPRASSNLLVLTVSSPVLVFNNSFCAGRKRASGVRRNAVPTIMPGEKARREARCVPLVRPPAGRRSGEVGVE